ncbi:transmembrane protein 156 [Rhynchocyon petersi]
MAKTALLKLSVAILTTIILILPEYFKTPKENALELSCLDLYLQPNLIYLLSSLNVSFLTLLQPLKETQLIRGIFLNHTHSENFTRIFHTIMTEFKMCSSCLVCECRGNVDFISPEQTSKVLVMSGSVTVKASDVHSPCQHLNFTVTPLADHLEEHNTTCHQKNHSRNSAIVVEDPSKEKSRNRSCNLTCSMKTAWYVLVLLVFILLIIFIIHKTLESHQRVTHKWQSHKCKPTSVLLRESDSEKLRALNMRVISDTTQRQPLTQVNRVLAPIPELEDTSTMHL